MSRDAQCLCLIASSRSGVSEDPTPNETGTHQARVKAGGLSGGPVGHKYMTQRSQRLIPREIADMVE